MSANDIGWTLSVIVVAVFLVIVVVVLSRMRR